MKFAVALTFALIITSCSTQRVTPKHEVAGVGLPSCYILYDAGSSGTRLYVYERQGIDWVEHSGPKASAIADPIRQIHDKTLSDIDSVTSEIVAALDGMQANGPPLGNGKPQWLAFNWPKQCHIKAAFVYATAGMRIAEQENREKSIALWSLLNQKLRAKLGSTVLVNTRTLTGYEEGLYAFLAVRNLTKQDKIGVAEMGGASAQVTFPCPTCDISDDAVQFVIVDDSPRLIYSYSFLGLGQDEAPKTLGMDKACSYGIGETQPNWQVNDCAKKINLSDSQGIRDPYNFNGGQRGTHRKIPSDQADVGNWYLTGAFNYLDPKQIDTCCISRGKCHNAATSCFRSVYLDKYLQLLNIPKSAEKINANWTLGAAICAADDCLQKPKPWVCRWSDRGCLQPE